MFLVAEWIFQLLYSLGLEDRTTGTSELAEQRGRALESREDCMQFIKWSSLNWTEEESDSGGVGRAEDAGRSR